MGVFHLDDQETGSLTPLRDKVGGLRLQFSKDLADCFPKCPLSRCLIAGFNRNTHFQQKSHR